VTVSSPALPRAAAGRPALDAQAVHLLPRRAAPAPPAPLHFLEHARCAAPRKPPLAAADLNKLLASGNSAHLELREAQALARKLLKAHEERAVAQLPKRELSELLTALSRQMDASRKALRSGGAPARAPPGVEELAALECAVALAAALATPHKPEGFLTLAEWLDPLVDLLQLHLDATLRAHAALQSGSGEAGGGGGGGGGGGKRRRSSVSSAGDSDGGGTVSYWRRVAASGDAWLTAAVLVEQAAQVQRHQQLVRERLVVLQQ
jgi:hypothetical protein